MFNLIENIHPSGDYIAGYRVDLDRDYTVAEFIEHVPQFRKKNTNFVARELKEAIFEEIEKGPFKGRICASRREGTGELECWKEYVETGFLIVKRYLEKCGFKKVEYIRKIENFNIWFALFFDYEIQREVIHPPIELHPGTTKDLLPR